MSNSDRLYRFVLNHSDGSTFEFLTSLEAAMVSQTVADFFETMGLDADTLKNNYLQLISHHDQYDQGLLEQAIHLVDLERQLDKVKSDIVAAQDQYMSRYAPSEPIEQLRARERELSQAVDSLKNDIRASVGSDQQFHDLLKFAKDWQDAVNMFTMNINEDFSKDSLFYTICYMEAEAKFRQELANRGMSWEAVNIRIHPPDGSGTVGSDAQCPGYSFGSPDLIKDWETYVNNFLRHIDPNPQRVSSLAIEITNVANFLHIESLVDYLVDHFANHIRNLSADEIVKRFAVDQ